MYESPIRVLVVEDDLDYVEILRLCLSEPEGMGLAFEIDSAVRLAEGLTKLAARRYDAVLVDLGLPDAQGLEAALAVLAAAPDTPVLVSTNSGDEAAAQEAMRLGAQDFMIKASSDSRMLKRSIRYAIERKAALAQRDQIIRAAAEGMVVVDSQGLVQFANAAAEKILGATAAELIGRPFPRPVRVGESATLELSRPDGTNAVVELRVNEVLWHSGRAALACLYDLTDRRRVEQLKIEVAERKRTDEMKDKWLGTISHELRTPLTIIKGAVVDLDEGQAEPLRPQQAMLVGLARRQTERIEKMVSNLLDLTRMESGRARLERKPIDPGAVVRRVAADFQRAAAEHAIKLETKVESELQPLFADADMFEQLIVNLVDNALRFARSRIVVHARAGRDGACEVAVQDDGVGIPPEKKSALFTRFSQLERKPASNGYKGTGLGLAICKEIVGLHRGRIEVDSPPGGGTTFLIALPAEGAATPAPFSLKSAER
jgi:signal transduction histidine kinase